MSQELRASDELLPLLDSLGPTSIARLGRGWGLPEHLAASVAPWRYDFTKKSHRK